MWPGKIKEKLKDETSRVERKYQTTYIFTKEGSLNLRVTEKI